MLTEICANIKNYFSDKDDRHFGTFEIKDGSIAPLDFIKGGQYFRIVGSTLNDGVYQYPTYELADETFTGAVWAMNVPPAFVALADEIKEYCQNQGNNTAFTSESFGGYSYTKATNTKGVPLSWQDVFEKRLDVWRRKKV